MATAKCSLYLRRLGPMYLSVNIRGARRAMEQGAVLDTLDRTQPP